MSDVNKRWNETKAACNDINKPYSPVVAVNCSLIGDDNDYSCFLSNVVYELWLAGKKEMAYQLELTDPLLTNCISMSEFESQMENIKSNKEAQIKAEAAYYRNYVD